MRIAELAGRMVAVWGFGREGRAVLAALRARLPGLMPTLLCRASEMDAAQAFDAALTVLAGEPDADVLGGFDVVIKSPGISAYTPALLTARTRGTRVTSGTALWFAEHTAEQIREGSPRARVIGVTGTKGKSTTSAMIAHLARSLGVRTALAGNIGLPLLELLDASAELWVIELSSFQTGEAGPLDLGVITSLYEEHLDWHGSRERYVADKLKLADVSRQLLVNGTQTQVLEATAQHPHRLVFGTNDGWHASDEGFISRGMAKIAEYDVMPLRGGHNLLNACAALAALAALGYDASEASFELTDFQPLPHRLQSLGRLDGLDWINDSISTTPMATLAALDSLPGRDITVIVGGHDRGLDWSPFAAVGGKRSLSIIAQGANGPRIAATLKQAQATCALALVDDLAAAVAHARATTPAGGVILLSPGAPSFDQFHDYAERGLRFAEMAGFDGASIGSIAGLGVV